MFFVATAPSGDDGHVNCRPRGYDTFAGPRRRPGRVPRPHRQRGRDDRAPPRERAHHVMACAFSGNAAHLAHLRPRHGARARHRRSSTRSRRSSPTARARGRSSTSTSTRVTTSCGYAVPLMDLVGERDRLLDWARAQGRRRARRVPGDEERREHRRPARDRRVTLRAAGSRGCARAWPSSASTCCCSRSAPTCRTSPATRRCRSSGSRCSCCRATGDAHLVVPRLEAPRVDAAARAVRHRAVGGDRRPDRARRASWSGRATRRRRDRRPHVGAVRARPPARAAARARSSRATEVIGADPDGEGRRRDRGAARRRARGRRDRARDARRGRSSGRTELDVHRELVERMLERGHERVELRDRRGRRARGEPAPRADRRPRRSRDGDIVLCDFGGTMDGYCSDITRMFHVGEPPAEVRDAYAVLVEAQEAGVRAATVGTPCADVDAAARARDRRRRASASTSCTASVTASAPRRTKIRTWSRATTLPLAAGPRVQRRARHLLRGPVRHAARGHRRRDRRRPAPAQRRAARPRARRLTAGPHEARRARRSCCSGRPAGCCSCWVTTRRREVSLGYGWLIRGRLRRARGRARPRCSLTGDLTGARVRRARGDGRVSSSRPASRSSVSVLRRRGGVRGREELRADRRARVAAMIGRDGDGDARPRAAPGVPARARPGRAVLGALGAARGRAVRGRPVPARRGAAARRRGVPRRGQRRDAARPLVPRAAGPAAAIR